MFEVIEVKDQIHIPPVMFRDSVVHQINAKFANKVIPDVGLAISVFDYEKPQDSVIRPGQGGYYATGLCFMLFDLAVSFRLLVFRPFIGEIIQAKIKSASPQGIRLTLSFFDDIFIPRQCMQDESMFTGDGLWVWQYEGNNLFMDIGETVRAKVLVEKFNEGVDSKRESCYSIICTIAEPGLGLLSWWS